MPKQKSKQGINLLSGQDSTGAKRSKLSRQLAQESTSPT